jgi:hypothetical protein
MVMKHFTPLRSAMAMIELIFAIVVMGIVMMSAPMLINTATQSGYVAIQQEAINEASSQMNIILGYPWDESNTDEDYDATVLNVTLGDLQLDDKATQPKRRAGTPNTSKRIYINASGPDEFNASAIGLDTGETIATADDMDDFNGTSTALILDGAATDVDYIEKNDINISRTVAYLSASSGFLSDGVYENPGIDLDISYSPDFTAAASTGTTNIKRIQVTLFSTASAEVEFAKNITLHAFSCNIGSTNLERKQ